MRLTTLALIVCGVFAQPAAGFVCLQTNSDACLHWAEGGATLRSVLGRPASQLTNGTVTWDQNALSAANDWNSLGSAFRFNVVFGGQVADPCACPASSGDTPVMFSAAACGGGFGDIVAETNSCYDRQSGEVVNSAVFLNLSVLWDAYDGQLRPPFHDSRRVLLHEFGHVLGLAHPDDFGQSVSAIMNARESNLDRLTGDDRDGLFSLYPSTPETTDGSANTCALAQPGSANASWLLWFPAALCVLRRQARRSR